MEAIAIYIFYPVFILYLALVILNWINDRKAREREREASESVQVLVQELEDGYEKVLKPTVGRLKAASDQLSNTLDNLESSTNTINDLGISAGTEHVRLILENMDYTGLKKEKEAVQPIRIVAEFYDYLSEIMPQERMDLYEGIIKRIVIPPFELESLSIIERQKILRQIKHEINQVMKHEEKIKVPFKAWKGFTPYNLGVSNYPTGTDLSDIDIDRYPTEAKSN